jgi:transcriptional regulator with XRE-family HTH domain
MTATAEELFGKRVRAARKAAKLTLEEAAEKAHITLNHLSQIERGTRRPSFELIFDLARVLGVPALNFFVFEAEDIDVKAVRRKVISALENCGIEELLQIDRFIKFVLRP